MAWCPLHGNWSSCLGRGRRWLRSRKGSSMSSSPLHFYTLEYGMRKRAGSIVESLFTDCDESQIWVLMERIGHKWWLVYAEDKIYPIVKGPLDFRAKLIT